jgi:nucleoid DNA-binding protein
MKKKDIEVMLGAFLETVKEEVLDAGNEIRVRDFGTFKQKIGGM